MTTQDYLEESAKLCETVEFPVWEEEGQKCSLFTDTREWFRAYCRPEDFILWRQGKAEKYALHEAACIFENHWRVWLAVQGCYLVPTVTNGGVTDNYVVYDINDAVIACVESYYAAQIAAVKAVLGATREARSGQERSNTWFCEYCDRELEDDADVVLYGDIACCSRECAEGLAARFDSGRTAIPKKRDA